ncbi:MAG: adenylosuccinate lyase, partial [Candidatus Tectomicrobia bacterium]|nr:adenylosuccinate lyase [Candidatus Tectomicrobia bacterium]
MIERYSRPKMTRVWSPENKLDQWLAIELLALEALHALGQIPEASLERIREKARYDLARINQIEQEVKHDVIAFLTNVGEYVGEDARYLHYGMTSSDILDTGLALQLREAADLILEGIDGLSRALETKAREHQYTPMIGRTHGVHAEPITFGLKLAGWYQEVQRSRERLVRAREGICVGKISGAVGTYAHIPPFIERYVCERLGLQPAPTSTQILQRDRHAELLTALAILASSLEKFALEIRHLQRTEVQEAEEFFGDGQKGSSAMPHKRNPITAEQLCGQARLIRSYAWAALEDIPLWHERDISHSSVERVILPDSTILTDYMLAKMTDLVARLQVYPEKMRENLQRTGGTPFSQAVMLTLIRRGLSREEAYRLVQRLAMEAWKQGMDLKELIERDEEIQRHVTPKELADCFDLRHHLRYVEEIFQRAFLERNHQPPVVEAHGRALLPDRGGTALLERREKIYEG